eukprot:TRINITY_DN7050_c0_g1_i1.p1 TRINITY_DN7050_c0_g1~~TRINITY_DN7050_c0_g1_i1.p1  ORF type:complete len:126 (-),score=30.14 TRINITY_DN7050_c0_g1_i1:350-727(-)
MASIGNTLSYFLLFIVMVTVVGLAVPPTSRKVTKTVNDILFYPIAGLAAVYMVVWKVTIGSSLSLRREAPECEDKIEYYKNQRNIYLEFCVWFACLVILWVANLKSKIPETADTAETREPVKKES